MRRIMALALALSALALPGMGCRSGASPFVFLTPKYSLVPEQALRETARGIEAAVYNEDPGAEIAASESVKVEAPELRDIVRRRAIRRDVVEDLLDLGFAFENNRGLLELDRDRAYRDATTGRDRNRCSMIVMTENDDRRALYDGLRKENKIRRGTLSTIQRIFYEERVPFLDEGQKYQTAGGAIVRKGFEADNEEEATAEESEE